MTPCTFHGLVQNPISPKKNFYILLAIVTKVDIKTTIPNELILGWVLMNNNPNYIKNWQITHGNFLDLKDTLKYHGWKRKTRWRKVKRNKQIHL